ncbi:MAG: lipoate--protein ligase [Bacteroidota bacterium]
MIFIDNGGTTDAALNLALEEQLSKTLDANQSYFLMYQNSPSVVLGRNQNFYEEVDFWFARKHQIKTQRRISGGGAVYHDEGNLNYSFLQPHNTSLIGNWKEIADPVIHALNEKGVPAKLNYRNDILVEGKKISGTAQRAGRNLMISHGALLFDGDLDRLFTVLNPERGEVSSQSLKSFRSKVTNIKSYLPKGWKIADLRAYLRQSIAPKDTYIPTTEDWTAAQKLVEEKYQTWDWVFGRSPKFSISRELIWEGEKVRMELEIDKGGCISSVSFSSPLSFWNKLATDLSGQMYRYETLRTYISDQRILEFVY